MFIVLMRRLLWLLLIGLVGGAVYNWWRERSAPDVPAEPAWPPLASDDAAATPRAATADTTSTASATTSPASSDGADSGPSAWVTPNDDGTCPISHPIKANDNSGIFHVPEGQFYERTKAERCYTSAEAAVADGYRQAKS